MNIDIITSNGTPIELVRFFQLDDRQYLIFKDDSLVDESGHVTIRISEIGNASKITANAIGDDNWENVKGIIKNIVNLNKNNQSLNIKDLDYNSLEGIEIAGYKSLKLMDNYVELLKLNQTFFEKKSVENIIREIPEDSNNMSDLTIDNVSSLNEGLNVFNTNIIEQQTLENEVVSTTNEMPNLDIANDGFSVSESLQATSENNDESNDDSNKDFDQQEIVDSTTNVDYQVLYLEQLEIVKQLQSEIQMYQSKLETLKSIINN